MSVSIDRITIKRQYIEIFQGVMGPVNLFLQGKALDEIGKQILTGLNEKKVGDTVQITDHLKGKYSGLYEIKQWNLSTKKSTKGSTKGNPTIYEFNLVFQHI